MSRTTLSQTAYRRVREDIVEGRIPENSVLSERVLAERLGISRTPLRTAISQLEAEGIVDRLTNGVILVRSVAVEQLLEIVMLRQKLESAIVARAARYPLTPELAALRGEIRRQIEEDSMDFDTFWDSDERFHIALARAARFTLLPRILAEQRAVARRSTLTRCYTSYTDQLREHDAIIGAISAGDGDRAFCAMWDHFTNVRDRFLRTFSSQ